MILFAQLTNCVTMHVIMPLRQDEEERSIQFFPCVSRDAGQNLRLVQPWKMFKKITEHIADWFGREFGMLMLKLAKDGEETIFMEPTPPNEKDENFVH